MFPKQDVYGVWQDSSGRSITATLAVGADAVTERRSLISIARDEIWSSPGRSSSTFRTEQTGVQ